MADGTPSLRIYVVRHGETVANTLGQIQGHGEGELTATGRCQAGFLGPRLAALASYTRVYCSDLGRTRATLEHATTRAGLQALSADIVYTQAVRERSAGVLEGQNYGASERAARAAKQDSREFRAEGGESWVDVERRAERFFKQLLAAHPPSAQHPSVLVVTHGGWITQGWLPAVYRYLSAAAQARLKLPMPNAARNTAVYAFCVRPLAGGEAAAGAVEIDLLVDNCVAHLLTSEAKAELAHLKAGAPTGKR